MKDATIEKITYIKPLENSDNLELAYINNWQVCVGKGDLSIGEDVLYIRYDACINDTDQPDNWAVKLGINKYLGKHGRVKVVTLCKKLSNGIILKLDKLPIEKDKLLLMSEEELCNALNISHYEAPTPNDLAFKAVGLPGNLPKSDEENFQSLTEEELHINEEALLTYKKDGSSCGIYYNPEADELAMFTRNNTLDMERDNNYTKALRPYVEQVKFLGKYYNEPIAIRGEVCGNGINAHGNNADARKKLEFFMYGVNFPTSDDYNKRVGRFMSNYHFLDINLLLESNGLKEIKTVPLVEVNGNSIVRITLDLLRSFEDAPAANGEGVVLNGTTFTYKAKSAKYDMKAHK